MKRVLKYIVTAAVMGFALACESESGPDIVSDNQFGTLRAVWAEDPASRTEIQPDGTTVMWSGEEHIKVFFSPNYEADFVSSRYGTRKETEFIGPFPKETDEEPFYPEIWALYPYDEAAARFGASILLRIPSRQEAIIGSFSDNLFPAIARTASPDEPLTFYNVCGGVCFSITEEGIGSITFKSNDGTALAGTAQFGVDLAGKPVLLRIADRSSSVEFPAPKGGFIPGKLYYATFFPGTHPQGLSIQFRKGRTVAEKTISHSITVNRSRFGRLERADEGLEYAEEDISAPNPSDIILFADARMKEDCVAAFDTNGDGELSYQEAAAATSLDGVFHSKLYSSFEEFQFFTGIREIPYAFFQDWALLKRIILPEGVVSIGAYAFKGCRSLKSLAIPKTLSDVGLAAFYDCVSLTKVSVGSLTQWLDLTFPKRVYYNNEYYSSFPFDASQEGHLLIDGIEPVSLTIPDGYSTIRDNAFKYLQSITELKLPPSIIGIGEGAFGYCSHLTRVHVTSVQQWMDLEFTRGSLFYFSHEGHIFVDGEEIKRITVPESVTSLGSSAFSYCTGLECIILEPIVPPTVGASAFLGITCPVYVWDASMDLYLSDPSWKNYWKLLKVNPNSPNIYN